jgi:hypothetical protein
MVATKAVMVYLPTFIGKESLPAIVMSAAYKKITMIDLRMVFFIFTNY